MVPNRKRNLWRLLLIELSMEEPMKEMTKIFLAKLGDAISNERTKVWKIIEEIQPLKLMKWSFGFKKVKIMKHTMHNNSKVIKKKLKVKELNLKKEISSHVFF